MCMAAILSYLHASDMGQQDRMNKKYAQRAQTSTNPEDPDFGLWTPESEA